MARRKPPEEHANHEAWAIPYGDLVTLLLAFFVVMYSISTVNEGKYRVVSDSLNAAFRGEPSGPQPIQVGHAAATTIAAPLVQLDNNVHTMALRQMAQQAEDAMSPLIAQGLVDVQVGDGVVEIGIRSDILFSSGSAVLASAAQPVIHQLATVLAQFPNVIQVKGHTDNVPIAGGIYPSNWELSAARAASVVHMLVDGGIDPRRLAVVAYGEYRPVLPNTTPDGRNANRRVVLAILNMEPNGGRQDGAGAVP
jgi:chemotaxis protein MotB